MAAPYSATTVNNYNSNPPPDDGSTSTSNRVTWAGQKTKLADPIKTAFDTSETNTVAAFGKTESGAAILSTAVDYTVLSADQGKLVRVTASGKTVTTPDATVVGSPFWFWVRNASTGAITLAGNNPGVQQNVDGSTSLTIGAGVGCRVGTDGTNWFTAGIPSTALIMPQGYLTLTSGTPILTADTTNTVLYYTPFKGAWTAVHNGSSLVPFNFSEMQLTLTTSQAASNIYDVFIANNNGTPVIGTGPSWSAGTSGSITAGSCARGTGAGGTSLTRLNGVWVNNVQISLIWNTGSGNTTITVPANQGVYLGSIYVDGSAGQVTCHRTIGQSRKWGIYNAYNRVPVVLQVADPTANWSTGVSFRNSNGSSANAFTVLDGLSEELVDASFSQRIQPQSGTQLGQIAIARNSSAGTIACSASLIDGNTVQSAVTVTTSQAFLPAIGINNYCSMEDGGGGSGTTFLGTSAHMILRGRFTV